MENKIIMKVANSPTGVVVTLNDGKQALLSSKALWGWGRLQFGRKDFDLLYNDELKNILANLKVKPDDRQMNRIARVRARTNSFNRVWDSKQDNQRAVQVFFGERRAGYDVISSVASQAHSVIEPDVVMDIADKVFRDLHIEKYSDHKQILTVGEMLGTYKTDNKMGMRYGINFDAGTIDTQHAIFIGQFVSISVCTNPLVWARNVVAGWLKGSMGTLRFKSRLLRLRMIENKNVLEDRLRIAVREIQAGKRGLGQVIRNSKKIELTNKQAGIIYTALSDSYNVGKKVQKEVLDEFKETNGKSLFDLAMASSMIAHSSTSFHADSERARNTVSALGAITLGIKDVKKAYQICLPRVK